MPKLHTTTTQKAKGIGYIGYARLAPGASNARTSFSTGSNNTKRFRNDTAQTTAMIRDTLSYTLIAFNNETARKIIRRCVNHVNTLKNRESGQHATTAFNVRTNIVNHGTSVDNTSHYSYIIVFRK